MHDDLIERVAAALYDEWAKDIWPQRQPDWENYRPGAVWIRQARVAVEIFERLGGAPAQRAGDRDQIALGAAHQIEALPPDLHEAQKTARIQLIVLSALTSTVHQPIENKEGGAA